MTQFKDITITGLNDSRSAPSGRGILVNFVLNLSDHPPADWSSYFEKAWKQSFSMRKRAVTQTGNTLTVECLQDELQGQIDDLKPIIAETNAAYAKWAAEREAERKRSADEVAKQRADISDLKGKLKF